MTTPFCQPTPSQLARIDEYLNREEQAIFGTAIPACAAFGDGEMMIAEPVKLARYYLDPDAELADVLAESEARDDD